MDQLQVLMESDANVKAIHLIRDPRGCLTSQNNMGEFEWEDLETSAAKVCRRIDRDLILSQRFVTLFPNRVLTVRYEDITEHPIEAAEFLYNFVGLSMTDTIRNYIWGITNARRADNCAICTTRNNSKMTAYKWRQKINFSQVQVIQHQCAEVIRKLGFRNITNESQLTNLTFSTKIDHFPTQLFMMKHLTLHMLEKFPSAKNKR